MAALGCIKTLVGRFLESRSASASRYLTATSFKTAKTIVVRRMSGGHGHVMEKKPGKYEWKLFGDHLHFYVLLGAVPSTLIVIAVNLLIGAAELADIPEGYEPKPWEYHKHPITRFHARYVRDSDELLYERHLHFLSQEADKMQMRKLRKKVKLIAQEKMDSSFWFYQPVEDRIPPFLKPRREYEKFADPERAIK